MIARINNLLQRFRNDEDGVATVEFAIASPILVGLFLASLELGSTGFAEKNMSSSLRFSAQYVANGGQDLAVAENVFSRSYGQYLNFSAKVSCDCARARSSLDDEQAPPSSPSQVSGNISGLLVDAPQCTLDCGEDPVIRYLRLSASDNVTPILGSDLTPITNSVSVRLK